MPRPDIELYQSRANGKYGQAWLGYMEHVGMVELLEYVKELEQSQCKCRRDNE